MCLIFNFYIPFLTSVEEVDEEDEGRPEMPLERESFPEYEGKQTKWIKKQPVSKLLNFLYLPELWCFRDKCGFCHRQWQVMQL